MAPEPLPQWVHFFAQAFWKGMTMPVQHLVRPAMPIPVHQHVNRPLCWSIPVQR